MEAMQRSILDVSNTADMVSKSLVTAFSKCQESSTNLLDQVESSVVIDSDDIVPFLDGNEGGQVIFKGILDQSGTFVLDSSQFAALLDSVNTQHSFPGKDPFVVTSQSSHFVPIKMATMSSSKQNFRANVPIQIQSVGSQENLRPTLCSYSGGLQSRLPMISTSSSSSSLLFSSTQTLETKSQVENRAITLHSPEKFTQPANVSTNNIPVTAYHVVNYPNLLHDKPPLLMDMNSISQHPSTNVDVEPPIGKGPYRCQECGKTLLKWPQYKRHKAEHLDEKSFRCLLCSTTFNFEFNLKLHQMIHEAEISGCLECQVCPAKFSRLASLKSHVRVHEKEENLVCPECGDEFATKARLETHIEEHKITKSLLHRCRLCGKTFAHAALLKDHSKEHTAVRNQLKTLNPRRRKSNMPKSSTLKHIDEETELTLAHRRQEKKKKLSCSVCAKRFEKPSQLKRHMRIHTGEKPFSCKQCGRSFNQKGTLESHILSMHEKLKPFICHICNCHFSQRGNLKAHLLKVHVPPGDNEKSFKCEECPCVYRRLATLNNHISKAHAKSEIYGTIEKSSSTSANSTLEATQQKNVRITVKHPSSVGAGSDNDLPVSNSEISNNVHSDATSTVHAMQPLSENQTFQNNAILGGRNNVNHQPSNILKPQITEVKLAHEFDGKSRTSVVKVKKIGQDKFHLCPYNCTKTFRKPSDLIRHIRIHTQEKPFVCNICSKSFAVKSTLSSHMKTHSSQKDWECRVCNKQFSVLTSLRAHERLHTGAKPFLCLQCGKYFRTSSQRRIHIKAHSRNAQGPTGKRKLLRIGDTTPKIELSDPLRITSDGLVSVPNRSSQAIIKPNSGQDLKIRPYKCLQCPSAFKKSSHLKQHNRAHSGERPYKCFQCYRSFISSGVLKNHIKTHEGVRAYKCNLCPLSFTTNGSLTRHMATHTEERAFMCPYCHKTFKTTVACRKHIRTHRSEFVAFHTKVVDGVSQTIGNVPISVSDGTITKESTSLNQNQNPNSEFHPPNEELYEDHFDPGFNNNATESIANLNVSLQNGSEASITDTNSLLVTIPQQNTSNNMVDCIGSSSMQQQIQDIADLIERGQHLANGETVLQYSLPTASTMEEVEHQISLVESQGYDGSMFTLQGGDSIDLPNVSLSSLLPSNCHENNVVEVSHNPSEQRSTFEAAIDSSTTNYQLKLSEGYPIDNCQYSSEKPSENNQENLLQDVNEENQEIKRIRESSRPISEKIYNEMKSIDKDAIKVNEISDKQLNNSIKIIELDKSKINLCKTCGRGFKKRSDMVRHERIHSGEKPFVCHICEKRFRVKSTKDAHLRIHDGGIKTVACHVCNNMFSTKNSLRVHIRLHTGVRPYKCPHCDRLFRTSGHRKAHIKAHEKAAKDSTENIKPSTVVVSGINNTQVIDHSQQITNNNKISQVLLPPVETIKEKSSLITNSHHVELDGSTNCFTTNHSSSGLMNGLSNLSDPVQIIGSLQLTLDGPTVQNIQITGLDLSTLQLSEDFLQSLGNVIFMAQPNQLGNSDLNNSNLLGVAVQNGIDGNLTEEQQEDEQQDASSLPQLSNHHQTSSVLTGKDVNVGSTVTNMTHQQIQNPSSSLSIIGDLDSLVPVAPNNLGSNFNSLTTSLATSSRSSVLSSKNSDKSQSSAISNNKQCLTCGKTFTKPSSLKRHMTTHTGEKRFKCDVCNCTFNQKNSLDVHMYTHSNERPFVCSLCPFKTVVKAALKKHCSRAHPNLNWDDIMNDLSKDIIIKPK